MCHCHYKMLLNSLQSTLTVHNCQIKHSIKASNKTGIGGCKYFKTGNSVLISYKYFCRSISSELIITYLVYNHENLVGIFFFYVQLLVLYFSICSFSIIYLKQSHISQQM